MSKHAVLVVTIHFHEGVIRLFNFSIPE